MKLKEKTWEELKNARSLGAALIICIAPTILIFLLPAAAMVKYAGSPAAIAVLLLTGQLVLGGLYLFRTSGQKNIDAVSGNPGNKP
jgi:hypothetical protein